MHSCAVLTSVSCYLYCHVPIGHYILAIANFRSIAYTMDSCVIAFLVDIGLKLGFHLETLHHFGSLTRPYAWNR